MARPKKLKEEDYITVAKLASTGLTIDMIADFLGINRATAHRDKKFCDTYKKYLAQLGTRVRTVLISKMEEDITANIYLDKVINKTTEKFHDDRMELEREKLEIEKKKLELEKLKIGQDNDKDDKALSILEKIEEKLKNE